MSDDNKPYEIGYKKPPKEHQFKKGDPSRNPKGRKKGVRNFATLLHEGLHEKITINENGKEKKITIQQGIVRRTLFDALKGNAKAIDRIFKILPPLSQGTISPEEAARKRQEEWDRALENLNDEELHLLVNVLGKINSNQETEINE